MTNYYDMSVTNDYTGESVQCITCDTWRCCIYTMWNAGMFVTTYNIVIPHNAVAWDTIKQEIISTIKA